MDYAGVVAPEADPAFYNKVALATGQRPEVVHRRYWEARGRYELGGPASAFWSSVAERDFAPADDTLATLVATDVEAWTRFDPQVVRIITNMADKGNRIAMLANLPVDIAQRVRLSDFAWAFDRMLFSCDTGVSKPDPAAFNHALSQCQAQPQDVVFVDDRLENVTLASFMGLHAVAYSDPLRLEEQMTRWLNGRRIYSGSY